MCKWVINIQIRFPWKHNAQKLEKENDWNNMNTHIWKVLHIQIFNKQASGFNLSNFKEMFKMCHAFLSNISSRPQWWQQLFKFCSADEGQQENGRCQKSGQDRQRPVTNLRARPKNKKKTWSKHKVLDKLNNLVLFNKATYDKLSKEVPNYQFITQLLPLRDWRPPTQFLGQGRPSETP